MSKLRNLLKVTIVLIVLFVLSACGSPSKEDVVKKLSSKWDDQKGYEVMATMEINTGEAARKYGVEVWHTKPDFYRVNVTDEQSGESQMIVRNDQGVFVVVPSLGKTYEFQSNWPEQNSQAYLIEALAKDIALDEESEMTEEDGTYTFVTKTRNNHQKMLPTQQVHIDKKTLLPKKVSVLDENEDEQITITFNKISLGVAHKPEEYAVDVETPKEEPKEQKDSEKKGKEEEDAEQEEEKQEQDEATDEEETDEEDSTEGQDDQSDEENEDEAANFQTYYPTIAWDGVSLKEEEMVQTEEGTRVFMTYGDEKQFTLVEEVSQPVENSLPVSMEGDPIDLGFTVAALTEHSMRWESGGMSFYLASDNLTVEEMIQVAMSMAPSELK